MQRASSDVLPTMEYVGGILCHALRLVKRKAIAHNRDVRGTRVYLAARFARQAELRRVANELRAAGAEISARWLFSPAPLDHAELAASGRGAEMAIMDLADLRSS